MADIHNAIKYATAELGALQVIAGVDRGQSGVERVSESLTAVLDAWSMPEWSFLRGELLLGRGTLSPAGGAATFAGSALVNPAGSGKLLVITHAEFSIGVTGEVMWGRDSTATIQINFATPLTIGARDSRDVAAFGQTAIGRGLISIGSPTVVGFGQIFGRQLVLANTPTIAKELVGMVLGPGSGAYIQNQTANGLMYAALSWRERQTIPGELPPV